MKCYFCGKRIVAEKNVYSLFPYKTCPVEEQSCCKKCYETIVKPTTQSISNLLNDKSEVTVFYVNGDVKEFSKQSFGIYEALKGTPETTIFSLKKGYKTYFSASAQSVLEKENRGIKEVFGETILGNVVFLKNK